MVKQDGSGHFTQIQAAINASAHTDSIKVYPGTYVENIDYNGKNIFIYSLEYTSGNPAYRDSTIIDGNRNGSVVKSTSPTTNCGIYGFTIQNGSGSNTYYELGQLLPDGGGLLLNNASNFILSACVIKNNSAYVGGGAHIYNSNVQMKMCEIYQNHATLGGGLLLDWHGIVDFTQSPRSSVYDNIAGHGQDILASNTMMDLSIYLDKGTVSYHNSYYISYTKSVLSDPGTLINIDILQGYLTETDNDVYVSPNGCDSNSGLSHAAPLKSIHKAMQVVKSDSLSNNTIYLAPGNYSSEDGQLYPIGLKSFVKLQGAGSELTHLTNVHYGITILGQRVSKPSASSFSIHQGGNPVSSFQIALSRVTNGHISDVTINHASSSSISGMYFGSNSDYNSDCSLERIKISDNNAVRQSGLFALVVDLDIKELIIDNCNVTGGEINFPNPPFYYSGNKLKMANSKIINNSILYNNGNTISIGINGDQATRELKLDNVLVANNQTAGATPVFIAAFNDNPAEINNCTFANNSGSTYAVQLNGNFIINNSIFNNSTQREIKSNGSTSQLQFNNNFIRNYPSSTSFEAYNNVSFNEVVLSGDPGFCSSVANNPLSYRLGDSSICRDMGDANGLELPEYDLAGNPRIYGPAIDLGCYEWNYPVSTEDNLAPQAIQLNAFPNPFTEQLTLQLSLKQRGRLSCEFYNVKGQKVRSLADAHYASGEHLLIWDGCDNSGNKLSSGVYFMRMHLDGKLISTRKMVMVK